MIGPAPYLFYTFHEEISYDPEHFVSAHRLTHILCGTLEVITLTAAHHFTAGETVLLKRDELVRMIAYPAAEGVYKAVNIIFPQQALRNFATELQLTSPIIIHKPACLKLSASPLYESFVQSLAAYGSDNAHPALVLIKVKEALGLIHHLDFGRAAFLIDFTKPGKADLEEYMNLNYKFNISMSRFAYLTGRSLAAFKRDFNTTFKVSPGRWLLRKRLAAAYQLLREKGMRPSAVYHQVGFTDLSHFSYAFKTKYGRSPSAV